MTTMREVMYATMSDLHLERGLEFTDLTTLAERLKDKKIISMELLGKNVGWIRMSFITIDKDSEGRAKRVICTTQVIDKEKRKEEKLIRESTTDKLTHCFNRSTYENDLQKFDDNPPGEDFVFIAVDVNGLKKINDSLGHAEGDELLLGAATCMQRCFGTCGRVYRIGGDEFAAMIFADTDKLKVIKENLEETIRNWSGETISHFSISCGYATKREFADLSVKEMAKVADERMYQAKGRYYQDGDKH